MFLQLEVTQQIAFSIPSCLHYLKISLEAKKQKANALANLEDKITALINNSFSLSCGFHN